MDTSSSSSTYEDQPQAAPLLYQPYLPEPAMHHPTATLEESATYSRLILIDYLHRINNAVGDIHPSFELVRVDTLSIIRIHCTRVNTTPYHDGLAFSPCFFEPMGREVLATHREVHPGERVYSDSVAPWPAWPRQGEIERIENNRGNPIPAVASTGIIFLSARCLYRTTFTPALKRERDLVRRARYTQERVHRILNVLRNVRLQPSFDRAPGGSVAVSIPGTLRDVANAYTCHRT
ncbi:hypothetical protein BJY01DRAFT_175944 [Aspergillus pseudoustus]|uniref:Transcription factor domain-containing protein n=1 Tax=Aspergillus pseudoustus TaxID=1810923 RepID=A0ABR4K1M7_9EURO